jgi:hypothetical protein
VNTLHKGDDDDDDNNNNNNLPAHLTQIEAFEELLTRIRCAAATAAKCTRFKDLSKK